MPPKTRSLWIRQIWQPKSRSTLPFPFPRLRLCLIFSHSVIFLKRHITVSSFLESVTLISLPETCAWFTPTLRPGRTVHLCSSHSGNGPCLLEHKMQDLQCGSNDPLLLPSDSPNLKMPFTCHSIDYRILDTTLPPFGISRTAWKIFGGHGCHTSLIEHLRCIRLADQTKPLLAVYAGSVVWMLSIAFELPIYMPWIKT